MKKNYTAEERRKYRLAILVRDVARRIEKQLGIGPCMIVETRANGWRSKPFDVSLVQAAIAPGFHLYIKGKPVTAVGPRTNLQTLRAAVTARRFAIETEVAMWVLASDQ